MSPDVHLPPAPPLHHCVIVRFDSSVIDRHHRSSSTATAGAQMFLVGGGGRGAVASCLLASAFAVRCPSLPGGWGFYLWLYKFLPGCKWCDVRCVWSVLPFVLLLALSLLLLLYPVKFGEVVHLPFSCL